jgi:hypothetical protein
MNLFHRLWHSMLNPDGRRAWAFLALLGASGTMTAMVALVLWMVRANLSYVFYLGMAAHVQLAICITGFMAMFVKRHVEIGRDKVKFKDLPHQDDKDSSDVQ